ncbi:MAG: ATP-binding protein, partial [candidate division Zixibacteria bacterium]
MDKLSGLNRIWSRYSAPRHAERDATFLTAVLRSVSNSMAAVGIVGLVIPLIYITVYLFFLDHQVSWRYQQPAAANELVVWDKLLVIIMAAICLGLSPSHLGRRIGRPMMAVILITAAFATMMDDLARGDISLSPAWLVLLLLMSLAIPFRAKHTLLLCISTIGVYLLAINYTPLLLGWQEQSIRAEHLVFLISVSIACTGISGVLYSSLYHQHQNRRMLADINRELLEAQAQLVQAAKMASLGNLVAGVAHEINSPLGSILSSANTSLKTLHTVRNVVEGDSSITEHEVGRKLNRFLQILEDSNGVTVQASDRIDTIVRALKDFARLDEAERKKVDIHDGIESTLTVLPVPENKNIEIIREFADLPQLNCHPRQINQAVMILLQNAIDAIDSEGTVKISTFRENDCAVVRIEDSGRGIAEENLPRIFDPGYTTKGVGVGT